MHWKNTSRTWCRHRRTWLDVDGGGALLRDIDLLLKEETGLPVHVAEEPLNCVVKGCGIALENMEKLRTAFAAG